MCETPIECADAASSTASCIASTLPSTSRIAGETLPPVSAFDSARANCRIPTCIPSTLDEAIDSVRRSRRARGASAGAAPELRPAMACCASDITPATVDETSNSVPLSESGMKAWYLHARRYLGGA